MVLLLVGQLEELVPAQELELSGHLGPVGAKQGALRGRSDPSVLRCSPARAAQPCIPAKFRADELELAPPLKQISSLRPQDTRSHAHRQMPQPLHGDAACACCSGATRRPIGCLRSRCVVEPSNANQLPTARRTRGRSLALKLHALFRGLNVRAARLAVFYKLRKYGTTYCAREDVEASWSGPARFPRHV